jgi:hypothetical protein
MKLNFEEFKMSKGFYLHKLMVVGNQMKSAVIDFKPGLNVIAGASDTGKTYIFQCIDYMMGAQKVPKHIPHAQGYTEILLEIKTYDGRHFRLRRFMDGGQFHIKNLTRDGASEEIYGEKLSDKENNISTFLLSLCGMEGISLKKNKRNAKIRLSFRNIAGLCLADEKTIISEESPVYSNAETTERPKQQSLFYYLLTGEDASHLVEVEDPKIAKNKTAGKIEFLEEIIKRTQNELDSYKGEDIDMLSEELAAEYERLNLEYRKSIAEIDQLRNARSKYYNNIQKIETKLLFKKELDERFKLLKKHYENDLRRMEFVAEGSYLINQLNSIDCPLCGTPFNEQHIDHLNQFQRDNENLHDSITVESDKVRAKKVELDDTLIKLNEGIDKHKKAISKLRAHILTIDKSLEESLTPVSSSLRDRLQLVFDKRTQIEKYQRLRDNMQVYYGQLEQLDKQLKQKQPQGEDDSGAHGQALKEFCSIVEKMLRDWKYPDITSLTFNAKFGEFDIRINNIGRASNGKGYRAITYSAFLIGLMKFCSTKGYAHPYTIVLDSPLTTFKEGDQIEKEVDAVGANIEYAYFENLSKIGKNSQVIILENKEPTDDLKTSMNYYHFSGKIGVDRPGFFE